MITDKHSQTLIFWCQKSLSPTSNSDTSSVLQHWAVWLIIIKFIKQKWTLQECFSKYPKWSPEPDQEARRNFANAKVPSKNQQFWRSWKSLSQVFSDFPLEETRHTSPTSTENDPQKIVTHRIWQSTIRHTYRHSPYLTKPHKVKSPPSTSPLFKTFL